MKTLKFYFWISLASLTPFLVFFFFTTPLADDIFYHNYAQDKTTWEFLIHHYNTWTGRYFSNLMMAVNPFTLTSDTTTYPFMMIVLFIVFIFSLFFLLRTVIKIWDQAQKNVSYSKIAWPVTFIVTALFFHKMPRVTDTFYWFSGTSSHLLPACLLFISTALYLRGLSLPKGSMRPLSIIIVTVSSFIVSGSNETLAVQWIFTLFFTFVYQRLVFERRERVLILPFAAAVIGFLILYFAPGNAIRGKELHGGHDILLLLVKPWGLILETTVRYLSIAGLVALIAVFPALKEFNRNLSDKIKSKRSSLLLGLFGLGFFALTFVPSVWTMGGLPPRRVLNNMYLFFLIYGTFLTILYAHKLTFLDRWSAKFAGSKLNLVYAVSLLALFNNFFAWKDLANLHKYTESQKKRHMLISSGEDKDIILPLLSYFPVTFFYEDVTTKTEDYRNTVFAKFYKLKSVSLSQDYEEN